MKRILLFIFFCISFSSFSQSIWTKGNAVWHYGFVNIGTKGYIKLWEDGTVVLQGKTCIRMKAEKHTFYSGPGGGLPTAESVSGYLGGALYVSNDSVFYWNEEQEQFFVLFDFSAQQNDSWILDIAPTENFGCNDTSVCVVQSVGSLMLGGQGVVELNLGSTTDSFKYLEGKANSWFGTTASYLFPFTKSCDNGNFPDLDQIEFLCFEDDSLYYNPSGGACEYYLGLDQLENENVKIYPNPTSGHLNILSDASVSHVEVFDSYGKRCLWESPHLTLTELDLSGLNTGIYLVKITTDTDQVIIKRVQRN